MSLTDSIQQQPTPGSTYLKLKPPFGCVFKQKTKQQNIITASALLKKHLKGNPETSLQYFCSQEVVMEGREPHNHHYAPLFMNSELSHAGQEGPGSRSPPAWARLVSTPATPGSQSLPAFQCSPSHPKAPAPQPRLFPLPSRQPPHPAQHSAHLLQLEGFGGN